MKMSLKHAPLWLKNLLAGPPPAAFVSLQIDNAAFLAQLDALPVTARKPVAGFHSVSVDLTALLAQTAGAQRATLTLTPGDAVKLAVLLWQAAKGRQLHA